MIESIIKAAGISDELTIIKMRYAAEVLKSEMLRLAILFVFFTILNQQRYFVFAMVLLLSIRIFSGGLHFNTKSGCIVFSLCFFVCSIDILPRIQLPVHISYLMLIVSISLICIFSPIASVKRPIGSRKRYLRLKAIAIAIAVAIVDGAILLLVQNRIIYFEIGVWILVLQSIQLSVAWGINRFKKGQKHD